MNKFHVYENRTIFDGGKKMQGFSRQFAKDLKQELQSAKHLKQKMGDFSLRDMIVYLHQKRSELHTINDHFTPQIHQQEHLDIIKAACQDKVTSVFPLRVEATRCRSTAHLELLGACTGGSIHRASSPPPCAPVFLFFFV